MRGGNATCGEIPIARRYTLMRQGLPVPLHRLGFLPFMRSCAKLARPESNMLPALQIPRERSTVLQPSTWHRFFAVLSPCLEHLNDPPD